MTFNGKITPEQSATRIFIAQLETLRNASDDMYTRLGCSEYIKYWSVEHTTKKPSCRYCNDTGIAMGGQYCDCEKGSERRGDRMKKLTNEQLDWIMEKAKRDILCYEGKWNEWYVDFDDFEESLNANTEEQEYVQGRGVGVKAE